MIGHSCYLTCILTYCLLVSIFMFPPPYAVLVSIFMFPPTYAVLAFVFMFSRPLLLCLMASVLRVTISYTGGRCLICFSEESLDFVLFQRHFKHITSNNPEERPRRKETMSITEIKIPIIAPLVEESASVVPIINEMYR